MNKTIVALSILTMSTLSLASPDSLRQGIIVTMQRNDIAVLVNGRSVGSGLELRVPLPVGSYMVEGRKKGCFSDYEYCRVDSGTIESISLNPRRLVVQVSPRLSGVFPLGEVWMPTISVNVGARTLRHFVGGAVTIGKYRDEWLEQLMALGVNYGFSVLDNRYFTIEVGAAAGGYLYLHESRQPDTTRYFDYYRTEEIYSAYAGPRTSIRVGVGHIWAVVDYEFWISRFSMHRLGIGFVALF